MPQLITIGETMAAFTPDSVGALRYVQNFGIRTAGAESNVAVGLAKLGLEAAWVSRLGTDEFGCFIRNQLRAEGVDCSRVIYDPDHRTSIMFKETGVGETKVFYYRENSRCSAAPEQYARPAGRREGAAHERHHPRAERELPGHDQSRLCSGQGERRCHQL